MERKSTHHKEEWKSYAVVSRYVEWVTLIHVWFTVLHANKYEKNAKAKENDSCLRQNENRPWSWKEWRFVKYTRRAQERMSTHQKEEWNHLVVVSRLGVKRKGFTPPYETNTCFEWSRQWRVETTVALKGVANHEEDTKSTRKEDGNRVFAE